MLRPRIHAPTSPFSRAATSSSTPVSPATASGPPLKVRVPTIQSCSASPPTPRGSSRDWRGPAPYPSSESENQETISRAISRPPSPSPRASCAPGGLFHGLRDPLLHHPHEHIQRHRARAQHDVVELLQRELRPQLALGLGAELEDLQHADLVRARLPRHDDVALHFLGWDAVVDRLLARPVLGVEAGVDHQAAGAEELGVELAKVTLHITVVPPELGRELLGVERPALGEGRDAAEGAALAEARDLRQL